MVSRVEGRQEEVSSCIFSTFSFSKSVVTLSLKNVSYIVTYQYYVMIINKIHGGLWSLVIIQQCVDVHIQNCKLCNSVWLFCVDRQINRWII